MAGTMGDSFNVTGHPADLLTNAHLSVGTLVDVLDQMAPTWDQFTTVRVLASLSLDPVISVERDERVTRVDMSAVLTLIGRRHSRSRPATHLNPTDQVKDLMRRWVNTLAASDREATEQGIRLVTFADPRCTTLALEVVVPRGKTLSSFTPSATLTPLAYQRVRANATSHALRDVEHVTCVRDGTAVIWAHPDPRLSSVIFADPDPVARWAIDANLVCVYTPGFPVVGAAPAAALRLAEETMVDHHLLPFATAGQLKWKKRL